MILRKILFASFAFFAVQRVWAQDGGLPGSVFRSFISPSDAGRAGTGSLLESGPFAGLSNPAALGGLESIQLGGVAAFRSFGRGARTFGAAGALGKKGVLSLAWFSAGNGNDLEARIGPSDKPDFIFSDGQNLFDLSGAFRAGRKAWAGLGFRLYQQRIDQSSGVGFGINLGGTWDIDSKSRVGASLRDLVGGLTLPGLEREAFPLRWGLGFRRLLVGNHLGSFVDFGGALKQEIRWGLGAEFAASGQASIRAGWGDGRLGLGGGARIRHRSGWVRLDYGLLSSPISFWKLSHSFSLVMLWSSRKRF